MGFNSIDWWLGDDEEDYGDDYGSAEFWNNETTDPVQEIIRALKELKSSTEAATQVVQNMIVHEVKHEIKNRISELTGEE